MTVAIDQPGVVLPVSEPKKKKTSALLRAGMGIGAALLILATVRAITGTDDLTSSGTSGATLRLAIPVGLAAMGGIWAERTGVVNIGLEGMMVLGTWFAAYGGWQWGPWWGLAFGVLGGALGGLVHAVATVSFGVDHIVSGVAINILGPGVARFLSVTLYDVGSGGGANQSPNIGAKTGTLNMPVLTGGPFFGLDTPDVLGSLEGKGWWLISDAAGIAGGFFGDISFFAILAIALVPATWFLLWRTSLGLRMRSVGEHPDAADSLGVSVYRMKYIGVVTSGAFAGLAGAFLAIESAGIYRETQTGGRGFIGLAAVVFGNWNPAGAAVGSLLFGFTDALNLREADAVHALLLAGAIALAALAVLALREANHRRAMMMGVAAVIAYIWWATTDSVPSELIQTTPYIVTLLVLSVASQRLRPPAADGVRWSKDTSR